MLTDLKVAARGFRRTPGFTATALLTLALCLGANLTIFAVIDSVLLRPLPFPAPDRLVTIYNTYPQAGVDRDGASVTNYYERRGTIPALAHVSLLRYGAAIVGEAGATQRTEMIGVTSDFFTTLEVAPKLGRGFTDDEMVPANSGVVILTDGYWRQHFNADPGAVGRSIRIDGLQRTIVGVMPAGFTYLSSDAGIFLPLATSPAQRGPNERHSGSNSEMIARLAPRASIADVQSQIDAQNAVLERDDPEAKMIADAGFRSVVVGLHADHVAGIRPTLLLMQTGVLLLLMIGGVNLVNLLLIRASGRARELAIRQSMGATTRHVVAQVMTETVALTMAGGVLGIAVGWSGIRLLMALGIERLPLGAHVELNAWLVLITLLGALGFGMVLALPIAWFNLRGQLATALKSESRGGTSNRAAQRLRHAFIVAQVSLAFVLLAGSGLLGLSLQRAMRVSPGFRADHVLTGHLTLPAANYPDGRSLVGFTDRLIAAVRSQPGVTAAGAITNIPLSGRSNKSAVTPKDYVFQPGESVRGHYSYGVTGDYFTAIGIPLRDGRFLTADDAHRGARVCVVDEAFAQRYWPNASAVGQQVYFGGGDHKPEDAFTIVGIVGAVKQADVTESGRQGAVYFTFDRDLDRSIFVVTRTVRTPDSFAASMSRIVRGIDSELPVDGLQSMQDRIANSLVARRSPALLAGIFAAVALLLASIGSYGVLSYAVAQRRREIGIRLALGAQPRQIGRQFLTIGVRLLAAGSLLGFVGTWMAGRLMRGVLFDVPTLDVAILVGTAMIMTIVSLVASVIPARRAANVDPSIALLGE